MFAIIKDDKLIWFCDYKITEENMKFDNLIEWDFDTSKIYEFIDWEIKEVISEESIEIKKQNEINLFKEIEKKATEKRSEYLTAEMLPEWIFKDMKLEKLIKEWDEIKAEYETKMQELISKYWEEILQELL